MTNATPIYDAVRAHMGFDPEQRGDFTVAKYLRMPPPDDGRMILLPLNTVNATTGTGVKITKPRRTRKATKEVRDVS